MILIHRSETADTRTCDFTKVSKEALLRSSVSHIRDVRDGLAYFRQLIQEAAEKHDADKITDIDGFYTDFQTGFEQTGWWDRHRKLNRHHLNEPDGVPADVNLIDVLDYIADCVMAGMARSGKVRPVQIDSDVLWRAFRNTAKLLERQVEVYEQEVDRDGL